MRVAPLGLLCFGQQNGLEALLFLGTDFNWENPGTHYSNIVFRDNGDKASQVEPFTVQLALATMGVLHVSGPPVEATIALSIVFVASEILHLRQGRAGLARASHQDDVVLLLVVDRLHLQRDLPPDRVAQRGQRLGFLLEEQVDHVLRGEDAELARIELA